MPRRILVVRIGAMGDVLHALPAVSGLHKQSPETQIDWVVDTRWAPLLVNEKGQGPVVSGVHLAETRLWSAHPFSIRTVRSVSKLRQALRQQRYDSIVDMQGTLRSAVVARMADGDALNGYADPREAAARWLYPRRIPRRGAHVVDQGTNLLGEALGCELIAHDAGLPRHPGAERWAEAHLSKREHPGPVALLAPSAGWGAKQWPAARFAALARELGGAGWTVLVNASSLDDALARAVERGSDGAAQVLVSDLSQLIELERRVDVVVGGDSGPVHLAATLGKPLVALFGPTDPARNGPWGPGSKRVLRDASSITTYKRRNVSDPGLERIRVQDVLSAIEAVALL